MNTHGIRQSCAFVSCFLFPIVVEVAMDELKQLVADHAHRGMIVPRDSLPSTGICLKEGAAATRVQRRNRAGDPRITYGHLTRELRTTLEVGGFSQPTTTATTPVHIETQPKRVPG